MIRLMTMQLIAPTVKLLCYYKDSKRIFPWSPCFFLLLQYIYYTTKSLSIYTLSSQRWPELVPYL